ncbi:hypothetical protein SAMN06265361_10458 [Laceyella tengchongensis]|uniref:DUF4355 domain-containing protein n=1 Tax=Laceyella tengchongensis TaxID=574699 RepID=A0AA45WPL8_9BACL|nr:hypothetical protein [Laceyella tengchongensis]SMP22361.1 hypothetical protein SAMN06265361_10458 [Laceyella tengchongensis]
MTDRNDNAERGFIEIEQYTALRKEHMNAQVEIEKLRAELERLAPFKTKWLDKVKNDLMNEYNIPDEQREYWAERITGDSEEELKDAVERLWRELKLDARPAYVDPVSRNPRAYMPSSNVKKALYDIGRQAAEKALGMNEGGSRVVERGGVGARRSVIPTNKPMGNPPMKLPPRNSVHGSSGWAKLFKFFGK